jgi:hypothetical protein
VHLSAASLKGALEDRSTFRNCGTNWDESASLIAHLPRSLWESAFSAMTAQSDPDIGNFGSRHSESNLLTIEYPVDWKLQFMPSAHIEKTRQGRPARSNGTMQ